jgi:hypothetical protein
MDYIATEQFYFNEKWIVNSLYQIVINLVHCVPYLYWDVYFFQITFAVLFL